MKIDENLHWLLSFYRTSEIGGALFFGQLARRLKPGPVQQDMTRHFADEAQHARYWTDCLEQLGAQPLNLGDTYQDRYLAAAGLPVNLMEILAITHVFEKRVFRHYIAHKRQHGLPAPVTGTLDRIMVDEKWHIQWVGRALRAMEPEFGADLIGETLARYSQADADVYQALLREHADRVVALTAGEQW